MKIKVTAAEAREQLLTEKQQRFTTMMKQGSMTLEYYAPSGRDLQTPHRQDELYVILSGTAVFNRNGERTDCKPGDTLFVPASMEHRFENFSNDFATWVIFYGPDGGEQEI